MVCLLPLQQIIASPCGLRHSLPLHSVAHTTLLLQRPIPSACWEGLLLYLRLLPWEICWLVLLLRSMLDVGAVVVANAGFVVSAIGGLVGFVIVIGEFVVAANDGLVAVLVT